MSPEWCLTGESEQWPAWQRNHKTEDKYNEIDCQGIWLYIIAMNEVAKNVYVAGTIVTDLIKDPRTWLDDHEKMPVRYVGGIHNLSQHDKMKWACEERGPLRVVETGTGREEVWFPSNSKAPQFISLDSEGRLTSHDKYDRRQPTLTQDIRQKGVADGLISMVAFGMWYQEDHIHRIPGKHDPESVPAVISSKMRAPVEDDEYIVGVEFSVFREYWTDGEWKSTKVDTMNLIFANSKLNKPEIQEKATDWIANHCDGGFFPLSKQLFGEEDEEFMFLTDICSQG